MEKKFDKINFVGKYEGNFLYRDDQGQLYKGPNPNKEKKNGFVNKAATLFVNSVFTLGVLYGGAALTVNYLDSKKPKRSRSGMTYHEQRAPDRMATLVMKAMTASDPYKEIIKIGNVYGKEPLVNGMVTATIGAGPGSGLDGINYEKYLRVYCNETRQRENCFDAYKDRDPKELINIVFSETINPAFINDPRTAALIIGGKEIQRMSGNAAYTKHVKRLEQANLGGVKQFKREHGRYPNASELDKAMRHNVMNEGKPNWNSGSYTVDRWNNSYSGQSGESTAYGRDSALRQSVPARERQIQEQQRQGMEQLRKGSDEAREAIQRMLNDQIQRTQEKRN